MPDFMDNAERFEAIAKSLNKAFGRNFFARVEDEEFIVTIGGRQVWMTFDGEITGESNAPETPQL